MEDVLEAGTFIGHQGGRVYYGIRYDKDRIFTLRRLLRARALKVQSLSALRLSSDFAEPSIFLSFESEYKTRHRIFEGEWYVVNSDNEVYILGDSEVAKMRHLKPLEIDWDKADIFPRKLHMNQDHSDTRYGKDN